jgi:hypothetical protein
MKMTQENPHKYSILLETHNFWENFPGNLATEKIEMGGPTENSIFALIF